MMRVRHLLLTLLGVLALVAPFGATAAAAPATAFTPAQLVGPYVSDIPPGGTYIPVLDGFTAVREDHPEVIQQNLQTTIRINNSASPATRADAVDINYDDRLESLSIALGDKLGAVFRRLLAEGKLPKVAALAEGDIARVGLPMQTTLLEKEFFNNPRPFVVAPKAIQRSDRPGGHLYAELTNNGSYPSGHTSQGYWKGALLAYWLPELGPQIIARAGEIGRSRIVLGVHYPLDVMGGRLMAMDIAASRLADPGFGPLIAQAGAQLRAQLEQAVGMPLARFIDADTPFMPTTQARQAHRGMMTYGFDRIDPAQQNTIPASAAWLLKSRFPNLSDSERLAVLTRTAIPAGYPLDLADSNGGWLRIDLAAAFAATP